LLCNFPSFLQCGAASASHLFQSDSSGVVFNAESGYILTGAHVIENAGES
jgi:S1-C subfamily serine protease